MSTESYVLRPKHKHKEYFNGLVEEKRGLKSEDCKVLFWHYRKQIINSITTEAKQNYPTKVEEFEAVKKGVDGLDKIKRSLDECVRQNHNPFW